ncbi:hypothetical protein N9230_03410 [Akkermansiaceae bacterium]|nr:hypothetical protein [Akkermansiaceae bacterium]
MNDQMTLAGEHLLFRFREELWRLSLEAAPGSKAEKLAGQAAVISSSAYQGRVAMFWKGELSWFDVATEERASIGKVDSLRELFVDSKDGTVYGFSNDEVMAWREGKAVDGFPRSFTCSKSQKIGRYWYSHGSHGTIHRFNEQFEPDPGVVLGGASGSFIGYLPRSVDITHGTGLEHLREDLFIVSGHEGVVQLLQWQEKESQFNVVRRIGALHGLKTMALDADGNIWTPRGSWRWDDNSATPLSLGDVEPYYNTQPVVLGGKAVCFIKNHYNYIEKCWGTVFDANDWAHFEKRGLQGYKLEEGTRASTAFTNLKGQQKLMVSDSAGKAAVFSLSDEGHIGDNPDLVTLPGLKDCTSLAWFQGYLLAADSGAVVVFRQSDSGWKEERRIKTSGMSFVHSDGKSFVICDSGKGVVRLFESLEEEAVAQYEGLSNPELVVVSGDRLAVYEAGKNRLVKLRRGGSGKIAAAPGLRDGARGTKVWNFAEADFFDLGEPGGLPIAVALRESNGRLQVTLKVPEEASEIRLGVANAEDAYVMNLSARNAEFPPGDWSKIRLAVFVKTPGQQERVGFLDHQPIHAPFSEDPAHWAFFDLENYREVIAERRAQIRLEFTQAIDGKATLVVENDAGEHVRNLVSGQSFREGKHTVVWDGLDEVGKLVAPGRYRWRGISHPGIKPEFKTSFAGGGEPINDRPWGTNHGLLQHAVSNEEHVFFAAPVTEGGWALMALDAEGKFVQGYEHQQGFGIGHNAIAIDEKYLYCAQDGFGWGGGKGIDYSSDSWTSRWDLTVARYDLKTGKVVEFPGKKRAFVADTMEVGPGSKHPDLQSFNLAGLVVQDGKIYVGSRDMQAVFVFDAQSGEKLSQLPIKNPRHLAAGEEGVFVATDDGIDSLGGKKRVLSSKELDITGFTIAPNGDFWLSDGKSHQVHRYTPKGERIDTIGVPGGPYQGVYDPNRMVNPAGLTVGPKGKLWVTEKRWNPKRILAWDLKKREVGYEKFGIPHYGGDGSGFDPENVNRWIGLGCLWNVDLQSGAAKPTHIMSLEEAHFTHYHPQSYSFFREGGRTFLYARGKIALILELLDDGTTRPIAASCGTHHFAYGCDWDPPRAYIDAFYAKWPGKRKEEKPGRGADGKPWASRIAGVLWVDRNGDGETQVGEFSFTKEGVQYADGAWGHRQDSLAFRIPTAVDNKQVKIVEIRPRGFLANGIPDYPSLEEALSSATTDVSLTPGYQRQGVSTARDRFGRFVFNSDPEMNAYGVDGKHLWSYPNQWSNVHGSHKAPLPETGVIQGAMAILGMAPFDDTSDVFFLSGNHGRCFLLTSDGLYLDECFTDVRVSYQRNEYRLGGEIFGGMFDRSMREGNYYVQIGHGPYRIYQVHGLDQAQRMGGEISVSPDQIAAAERGNLRKLAERKTDKSFQLPGEISWEQSGKLKVKLNASIEGDSLNLTWQVQDPSPWINKGRDWTTLFASGDTVDLQIGTDPKADPKRRSPVPGDQRLLIAPHEGKAIAVLYQYRKEGGANPIEFTSPWRGATVDHVQQVPEVEIKVRKSNGGYVVEARVPLTTLNLKPTGALRADFGATFGDAGGSETQLRSYWANPATMLVDDIPGEVMLHPNLWGEVKF